MAEGSDAPTDFNGEWQMYKQENFDAFMSAIGVNFMIRKMASLSKPKIIIVQKGNHFHITTKSSLMTQELEFDIGVEFETTAQKKPVDALGVWEDKKMSVTQTPRDKNYKATTVRRSITDEDEMLQELICEDVVAKRWFKRV